MEHIQQNQRDQNPPWKNDVLTSLFEPINIDSSKLTLLIDFFVRSASYFKIIENGVF